MLLLLLLAIAIPHPPPPFIIINMSACCCGCCWSKSRRIRSLTPPPAIPIPTFAGEGITRIGLNSSVVLAWRKTGGFAGKCRSEPKSGEGGNLMNIARSGGGRGKFLPKKNFLFFCQERKIPFVLHVQPIIWVPFPNRISNVGAAIGGRTSFGCLHCCCCCHFARSIGGCHRVRKASGTGNAVGQRLWPRIVVVGAFPGC